MASMTEELQQMSAEERQAFSRRLQAMSEEEFREWFYALTPEEQREFDTSLRMESLHRDLSRVTGLPLDKVREMSLEEWKACLPSQSNEQIQAILESFYKLWPSLKDEQ